MVSFVLSVKFRFDLNCGISGRDGRNANCHIVLKRLVKSSQLSFKQLLN